MFARRWLRLLPGRSQLMLLAGLAFAVVAVIIFADLAVSKSATVASYQRAKAKVEQLERQNSLLQRDLERDQHDQQAISKGYEYFGQTPAGVKVVVGEPETSAVSAVPEPAPDQQAPFWTRLWQRLRRP